MAERILLGRHGAENIALTAITIAILVLILLPIAVVLVMSFTAVTTLQFPPPALSTRWYGEVWEMLTGSEASLARLRESTVASLVIAAGAATTTAVAGVPAAYALTRFRFAGRLAAEEWVGLPLIFPTVVLGISLLVIVSLLPFDLGMVQIMIAHSLVGLPFMVRTCMAALEGIDTHLEEAARTLGASGLRAFAGITFPLMRGGVASGILLVFILSYNEFTLSYFLYTVDVFPLPIWLFQQSNTSFSPAVFAVSSLIILVNVIAVLLVDRLIGNRGSVI
jgi:putative spermidine/putrescine transport system permease protein